MIRALAVLALMSAPAFATDAPPAPPAFVPITIDQAKAEQIEKSLADKRHDYAQIIEGFLAGLEQEAQQAAKDKAAPAQKK